MEDLVEDLMEDVGMTSDGQDQRDKKHHGTNGRHGTLVPQGLWSSHLNQKKKKVVLHLDLKNTIVVWDTLMDQGTEVSLNIFLSTVTWGRMNQGQWEWLSDALSLLPPRTDAVSYFTQFGRTPGFTSGAGERFRRVLEEHLDLLRWPEDVEGDSELSAKGPDGQLYHWIVPSFFQLLKDLTQEGQDFAVLFRTFGTDLPRALRAMNRALNEGTHPLFPDLPDLKLSVNMTPGKICCSQSGIVLSQGENRVSTMQDGDRGLYQYLSSFQGLGGFRDHFDWWESNSFSIRGGKPMWVDPFDKCVQHIFIDDNVRPNDEHTIVQPKVFLDPGGDDTRLALTPDLYDTALVQCDLLRAISDRSYFTERVRGCLKKLGFYSELVISTRDQ
ncbi:uncharacterized protein LOC131468715 isoform X2 [Solea solea]|uniref:uncharacterized protein LOC131468715 isoform X2 n=1 Tax=Solea solea TaxID=90069 RepID=UPI002729E65C|nr:uncharacterized protein LOC131468715 isoform X2 [Solea solea]